MTAAVTAGVISSIPSPPRNSLELGPLELRAYGVMIALGVVAAVWMSRRRWEVKGGDPEQISRIALWAVPAGLIGSRLYHVITDWRRFSEEGWLEAFAIWNGGLGIPGGMAAGILVGLWMVRRQDMDRGEALATIVPTLPLAQAIGRLGNWFNQEPRRSGVWATGSTRSCSARPPICRGVWRSIRRTARPSTSMLRPSIRPSCTRRSGICCCAGFC